MPVECIEETNIDFRDACEGLTGAAAAVKFKEAAKSLYECPFCGRDLEDAVSVTQTNNCLCGAMVVSYSTPLFLLFKWLFGRTVMRVSCVKKISENKTIISSAEVCQTWWLVFSGGRTTSLYAAEEEVEDETESQEKTVD